MNILDANAIALITLFATLAGLAIALFIHKRGLERSELSKVRDNLVGRLESLSDDQRLKDLNLTVSEREIIFEMHTKIIELDVEKYLISARNIQEVDLKNSLVELMIFDISNVSESNRSLKFRKQCYKLLSRIDKAYYHEIKTTSLREKAAMFWHEAWALALALIIIVLFFILLNILILGKL